MKTRVISAVVGLALLAVVAVFYPIWVFPVALALVGCIALFEAVRAFGLLHSTGILLGTLIVHILYIFTGMDEIFAVFLEFFVLMCVIIFTRKTKNISFRDAMAVLGCFVFISLGLGSLMGMRELIKSDVDGRFAFLIALALGWSGDNIAFLVGRKYGKKHMAPDISPNKTWEGTIADIVLNPIVITAVYWIYIAIYKESIFRADKIFLGILFIYVYALLGSVIGVLGDLSESYIKRECGIKDTGNIMPGHGGAFDRLDSVLFTSIWTYFAFRLFIRIFG
ncbi:MAG: phosphatidate cytidylyltransferase [Oscillospiraceae bacterium]|jgi:phosphatidate cytidylyltransferase